MTTPAAAEVNPFPQVREPRVRTFHAVVRPQKNSPVRGTIEITMTNCNVRRAEEDRHAIDIVREAIEHIVAESAVVLDIREI